MKVHARPPEAPPRPTPPVVPARASFSDLIAAPARGRAETADSAAGFQALGMFGVCGAIRCPSNGHPARAVAEIVRPSATPQADAARLALEPAQGSLGGAGQTPGEPGPGLSPSAPARSVMASRASMMLDGGPAAALAEEAGGGPAADAPAEAEPPRDRPRAPPSGARQGQVRVLASPADNATVVATLPGLSAEEADRFRARAQAVLREFGLTLDKVAVNGDAHPVVDPWGRGSQPWR